MSSNARQDKNDSPHTAEVLLNAEMRDDRDGLQTTEVLAEVLLNIETRHERDTDVGFKYE